MGKGPRVGIGIKLPPPVYDAGMGKAKALGITFTDYLAFVIAENTRLDGFQIPDAFTQARSA